MAPERRRDAWNRTYSTSPSGRRSPRRLYDSNYCGAGPGGIGQVSRSLEPNAPGNDREKVNREYADIRNNGDARPLSLAGWRFRDSALRWYTFRSRASVPVGRSIRVRMGVGRSTSSVFFCGQDSPPFKNDGHDAYLFDQQGDLRAWGIFPRRVG